MRNNYPTFIILSQLMLEMLDELKGTPMYRNDIKQSINRTVKLLEHETNQKFDDMHAESQEIVDNASRNIGELIKAIAVMDIADAIAFVQLWYQYQKDREGFIDRNNMYITTLDNDK